VRTTPVIGSTMEIRPVFGIAVPCSATRRLPFCEKMILVGARRPLAKVVESCPGAVRASEQMAAVNNVMSGFIGKFLLLVTRTQRAKRVNFLSLFRRLMCNDRRNRFWLTFFA